MEMITYDVKEKMGAKNVVDIYYHASEGEKHSGRENVECLNPIVYKQFLDKTIPILGSYVEFTPHSKSLEGTSPPTKENLKKYGFCDNDTALVNTIEALENRIATSTGLTKEDVEAIIEKGKKKLKKEMLNEAQAYARKATWKHERRSIGDLAGDSKGSHKGIGRYAEYHHYTTLIFI